MINAAPMRADAAVPHWAACLALVLGLHAGAASLLLRRSVIAEPPPALEAVLLDLAPEPAAPAQVAEATPEPMPELMPESQVEPVATPPDPEPEPPTPEGPDPPQAETIPEPPPPTPEPVDQPAAALADPRPLPLPPPPPPRAPAKRVVAQRPATQQLPRPVQGSPVAEQAPPRAEANPAPVPATASPNATATWMGELAGRLQRAKRYPEAARSRREQGSATVRFTFDRNGRVLAVSLARSSGSQALDEEAVALIRRIEPLPLPPPDLTNDTLTVPVGFTLR